MGTSIHERRFLLLVIMLAASVVIPFAKVSRGVHTEIAMPNESGWCGEGGGPVTIRVIAKKRIRIDGRELALARLPAELRERFGNRVDRPIFLVADNNLSVAAVFEVFDVAGPWCDRFAILTHSVEMKSRACGPLFPNPHTPGEHVPGYDNVRPLPWWRLP